MMTTFFRKPTPKEVAVKMLKEAERDLLIAEANLDHIEIVVASLQRRIERLRANAV